MHLMFLSNDSLQDPLHAGAYRLVIINIAAAHVRLVIFPRLLYHSARNYHGRKQGSKKHPVCMQKDIRREGSIKKQTNSLSTKIYSMKITNFS